MDGDVQACIGADRERRMRLRDLTQSRAVVEVLVAIPFAARDPPRRAVVGDRELGELVADAHLVQLRLIRELVAEADAVVERAEHDRERALRRILLDQAYAQLVVVITHIAALTPRLLPGFIESARLDAVGAHLALQLRRVAQQDAEPRL